MSRTPILILDGSALLYRSYYGLKPLTTSKGVPVQAVYGFCKTIARLNKQFSPDGMIIAWDSKGSKRKELYAQYKATRQAPPSDLLTQRTLIKEFCTAIKLVQIEVESYEADDLIGTLTHQYKESHDIIIVSPDKDLRQLLEEHVTVLDPFSEKIRTAESFSLEYGFSPKHLLMYHALVGDTSDNIPGVKGIGDKTATTLVQKFKNLDTLYENIETVTSIRTQELLRSGKDNAYLSEKLFTLFSVPLSEKIDPSYSIENWARAYNFFVEHEFSSFVKGLKPTQPLWEISDTPQTAEATLTTTLSFPSIVFTIVTTKELLNACIMKGSNSEMVALDTETTGLNSHKAKLLGISLAFTNLEGFYIPWPSSIDPTLTSLTDQEITEALNALCASSIKLVMHNGKFDLHMLTLGNIIINKPIFDTMIAAHLLCHSKVGLKHLSRTLLKEDMQDFKDLIDKKQDASCIPLETLAHYAAIDAVQTYKLAEKFIADLASKPQQEKLFTLIETPLLPVLFDMEKQGLLVDPIKLHALKEIVCAEREKIENKIQAFLEEKSITQAINLNSPQQVAHLLFDLLELPAKKNRAGSRSTDHDILQSLSFIHPIPQLILEYREMNKLISTYLEPLPELISLKTGRIHPSFLQTGTATGRLACSDPNLQNIPAHKTLGSKIRESFIASKNTTFLSIDYSQIELRVLAELSKDEKLQAAFQLNLDIHTQTAAQIFHLPEKEISDKQRQIGKKVNFSLIYGKTAYGLSQELRIPLKEASRYIETYFELFPGVKKWIESVTTQMERDGFVETFYGRKRLFPDIFEKNKLLFEAARRGGVNTIIQGTAAEIVKLSMIAIDTYIKKEHFNTKIILQIHDELLFEVPLDEIELISQKIIEMMESVAPNWVVPLKVVSKRGENWMIASK